MFKAQAVWKSAVEGEFKDAGFTVMVEVEPVSTNILPDSMSLLNDNIIDGRCDGFVVDLGTEKKYVIKN